MCYPNVIAKAPTRDKEITDVAGESAANTIEARWYEISQVH